MDSYDLSRSLAGAEMNIITTIDIVVYIVHLLD